MGRRAATIVTALQREPLPPAPPDGLHGAVVGFDGVVRDDEGRVAALEYEAYEPMARRQLEKIGAAAAERWPVTFVSIAHRLGILPVGEVSVRIVVAAAHRAAAFEACRFAIEEVKRSAPIWKKDIARQDGTQRSASLGESHS